MILCQFPPRFEDNRAKRSIFSATARVLAKLEGFLHRSSAWISGDFFAALHVLDDVIQIPFSRFSMI